MAHVDAHGHDDHAHAVVDGDDLPNHGPAIEEPRSPAWLPFLGLALFGLLLVWWLSTPNDAEEAAAAAAAASASAASASASAPAEAAPQPAAPPPPQPGAQFPRPTPQGQPPAANQPAMQINPNFKMK